MKPSISRSSQVVTSRYRLPSELSREDLETGTHVSWTQMRKTYQGEEWNAVKSLFSNDQGARPQRPRTARGDPSLATASFDLIGFLRAMFS
jgi:hypothetical protein